MFHVRITRFKSSRRSWARLHDQGVSVTACGAPVTTRDCAIGDLRAIVASPEWEPQLCQDCRAKFPEVR